jgi:hypothetical protein
MTVLISIKGVCPPELGGPSKISRQRPVPFLKDAFPQLNLGYLRQRFVKARAEDNVSPFKGGPNQNAHHHEAHGNFDEAKTGLFVGHQTIL